MEAQKAINKKAFNQAVSWITKHNEFDRQRNEIDSEYGDDCAKFRAIDRKCESSFDKYLEACEELPAYEVKRIQTSNLY